MKKPKNQSVLNPKLEEALNTTNTLITAALVSFALTVADCMNPRAMAKARKTLARRAT